MEVFSLLPFGPSTHNLKTLQLSTNSKFFLRHESTVFICLFITYIHLIKRTHPKEYKNEQKR